MVLLAVVRLVEPQAGQALGFPSAGVAGAERDTGSRHTDVLGARSLRASPGLERQGLPLMEVVEPGVGAGRLVEEVPVSSWACTKPKPLSVTRRLMVPLSVAMLNPRVFDELAGARRAPPGHSPAIDWRTIAL